MRRSIFIKGVLLFAALIAGIVLAKITHTVSSNDGMSVNVILADGLRVSVYKDAGGDGPFNYDAQQPPILNLSSSQQTNLKPGIYDFVLNNPDQYKNPVIKKEITKSSNEIKIMPVYTDTKLAYLLPSVRQEAQNALFAAYLPIKQNYTISKDQAYGLGDWYGAMLQAKNPSMDNLKVILHKTNNSWSMAIKEPMISIGKPANPNIPPEFIDLVDKL
jgi:hypothetical protein